MPSHSKLNIFIITGLLAINLSGSVSAIPLDFGDDTLLHDTEIPFRDDSGDFYGPSQYDAAALANSVAHLTEVINQRMGQVQTIRTALKLEGYRVIEAKIVALNQAHNDLTYIRAAGAIGPNQPFVFLNRLTRTFAQYLEGMDNSLKNSLVLPVTAATAYAYAEEIFFVLHEISKLPSIGVHWHQHTLQLIRALAHLKSINNNLLRNADTIGLLPQALVDLDDVLVDKISEIQEYGADRDVFRTLRVQTHQALKKRYVNDFLKKRGLPRDSYPEVKQGRQRPDHDEQEDDNDNYYLDSGSARDLSGSHQLPFR